MNIIEGVINRYIRGVINEDNSRINNIIDYLKGFSSGKGKLPNCTERLDSFYKPYLRGAYEWASEKLSEIRRDGFAYFVHLFNVYVAQNFKYNKRGLIYVERSIDISTEGNLDNLSYKSAGECWSWKKDNGRSYCSNFGIMDKIHHVVLCGYVHPSSIDWKETVYLNSYDMKNETEIRMNDDAWVEVGYIRIDGQKYSLGGSYLINASADKYKSPE